MADARTEKEKELLRKLQDIGEYCDRTGDHEPARKINALLDEAIAALKEGKQPAVVAKHGARGAKRPAKKATRKAGRA